MGVGRLPASSLLKPFVWQTIQHVITPIPSGSFQGVGWGVKYTQPNPYNYKSQKGYFWLTLDCKHDLQHYINKKYKFVNVLFSESPLQYETKQYSQGKNKIRN